MTRKIHTKSTAQAAGQVPLGGFRGFYCTGTAKQKNHYYPFGLRIADIGLQNSDNKYLYNSLSRTCFGRKEMQDDFGLDWLDYGFRFYDPEIGRFPSLDPLADQFVWVSPYNYAENSPIAHVDLWGLQSLYTNSLEIIYADPDRSEAHLKTHQSGALFTAFVLIAPSSVSAASGIGFSIGATSGIINTVGETIAQIAVNKNEADVADIVAAPLPSGAADAISAAVDWFPFSDSEQKFKTLGYGKQPKEVATEFAVNRIVSKTSDAASETALKGIKKEVAKSGKDVAKSSLEKKSDELIKNTINNSTKIAQTEQKNQIEKKVNDENK